jgi:hypothetical protein
MEAAMEGATAKTAMEAAVKTSTTEASTTEASAVEASAAHLSVAQIGRGDECGENNGKNDQEFARHRTSLPSFDASETHQTAKNIFMQVTNLSL